MKTRTKRQELRDFGYLMGGMVALIFGIALPGLFDRVLGVPIAIFGIYTTPVWPWLAAGCLWSLALMWPPVLSPLYGAWMKIGAVVGWINTRLILLLLFYCLILPIGIVMRLFGKDSMRRKGGAASYRIASHCPGKNHLERPY
jgi:hypothetical protein